MTDRGPLTYLHEAVGHQLSHSHHEIMNGDGLVVDFDYDEDLESEYLTEEGIDVTTQQRIVTLELTYILPE